MGRAVEYHECTCTVHTLNYSGGKRNHESRVKIYLLKSRPLTELVHTFYLCTYLRNCHMLLNLCVRLKHITLSLSCDLNIFPS